jgi:hypothetical protein
MLDLCYAGAMAAMDSIASKFAEYEYLLKLLTAKLEETVAENERLKANSSAHQTLQAIYRNEAESSNTRVRAAQAALGVESAPLKPVSQLELVAEEEKIIPLADVVRMQRARADKMLAEDPQFLAVRSHQVVPLRLNSNGNGSDDDTAG